LINHPALLIAFLLAIEIAILYLASHSSTQKYFTFLPSIFWIYFLPMLASTFGLIDPKAPIYQKITNIVLPASLFILLMTVDIKAIIKLGGTALIMMAAGSIGIMAGTFVSFSLFKNIVGTEFYSGFGCLSASWTGGSANMIAVKEATSTPDSVFLPMVIVDTIVPYVWMGILVSLVSFKGSFDRWNHSDKKILEELSQRAETMSSSKISFNIFLSGIILAVGFLGSFGAQWVSTFLPAVKDMISGFAWVIIVVSLFGIVCSFTPLRKLEYYGSNKIGYFLLYFVLTTIGAKASLSNIGSSLILISAGCVIVIVHILFLLVTARILKAPLFLVATASQANVGGVASSPIVAEIYQPGLASVGLLLAILGNIFGTYLGIITSRLCHWMV
jgi:uncharacterized membrane protein